MGRRSWLSGTHHDRWSKGLLLLGLTGYVLVVYAGVVVVGGVILGSTARPSLALSILATAIVALSFATVQSRLQRLLARAVRGGAPSPYDVLSRFSDNVAAGYRSDDLPALMASSLTEATGAEWAQVWLMVGRTPTLAATWPAQASSDLRPPLFGAPGGGQGDVSGQRALPVSYGADLLGALRLKESPNNPLTPVELRLFAGLAAQAGLVLSVARLRAELSQRRDELSDRTEDLRLSRQRLIDAEDRERRQLERDIHDGAQQHLVALAVNLRLAQGLCRTSPDRGFALLTEQRRAADEAIAALTELSRGIYPRRLEADGLLPALRAAVTTSPLVVQLSGDPDVRMPRELEAALYFCCLEALQNAVKHSGARRATVLFDRSTDGTAHLVVTDDGRGFDARSVEFGSGLTNMRDRADAAGGFLEVTSTPGSGTRIEIRLPGGSARAEVGR